MHLILLRLFFTFIIMASLVRTSRPIKRCGCPQCNDIAEDLRRCECCVYLLHGKRSMNNRVFRTLETTKTENNIDFYALEKRMTPVLRTRGLFKYPSVEDNKIITSNYLDDGSGSVVLTGPYSVKSQSNYDASVNDLKDTWRRILGFMKENEQSEDTYLYLV